jgi:hypothetical protein
MSDDSDNDCIILDDVPSPFVISDDIEVITLDSSDSSTDTQPSNYQISFISYTRIQI